MGPGQDADVVCGHEVDGLDLHVGGPSFGDELVEAAGLGDPRGVGERDGVGSVHADEAADPVVGHCQDEVVLAGF